MCRLIEDPHPSLEAFLAAPIDQVARVAPATVIFAPGGTRRSAVLAGISPQSDDYARWTRERMIKCSDLFFQLGVRHLFMSVMRPPQLAEVGRYRERILDWLDWGLAGPEALADYARFKWRVRLFGTDELEKLSTTAERLRQATLEQSTPTLWYYIVPSADSPWQWVFSAMRRTQAYTTADLMRALYGEEIPLATLYLAFGKPMFVPDLLPPLLSGNIQCYWTQRPGYELDESVLRRIIYDYAYLRPTWTRDKSSRYSDVEAQRSLWEQSPVLGLGRRVGAFWYPIIEQGNARKAEDI
jgi:hypothetical protein